jgi:hypothetical protein
MNTKKARLAGASARHRGKPISLNPYTGQTAADWRQGWLAAELLSSEADLALPDPVVTRHGLGTRNGDKSPFRVNRGFFLRTFDTIWGPRGRR